MKRPASSALGAVIALLALSIGGCSKDPERTSGAPPTPEPRASTLASSVASSPASAAQAAAPPASSASATALAPRLLPGGALALEREGQSLPAARAARVLHFGDSMVPLVGNYLRPQFEAAGSRYEITSTSSSSTLSWAQGDQLRQLLAKGDPDLVLVSLGSNELYFVDDLEARAAAIRSIVREIGGRSCLWIGPPSWAKVRGFLDTLEENLGHCSYFDSAALPMQRQADGRHPTWGASHGWANKVWQRLGGEGELDLAR